MDDQNDRTDYRNFPMDFTNIDPYYQTPTGRSYQIPSPGIFSPSGQATSYHSTPAQNYTPKTATQQLNQMPTPGLQNNYNPEGYMSSTPIPEYYPNVSGELQHDSIKWRKFIFKWILCVTTVSVIIAMYLYVYPWNDLISWLCENVATVMVTLLVLFLMSVIFKLLEECNGNSGKSMKPVQKQNNAVTAGRSTPPGSKVRRRLDFTPECQESSETQRQTDESHSQIQVKRTFSGSGKDLWADFLRYFENIAKLNKWNQERKRLVFTTTLRGQAETYMHGLANDIQCNWDSLIQSMELRFGHTSMKESYLAEARLRRRQPGESFRDLGQAIEDLYRRAYPSNPEIVQENSIRTFLDACGESEEFRMVIRRTKPKTLQEAVTSAMQEECIRINERHSIKQLKRNVYGVDENKVQEKKLHSGDDSQNGRQASNFKYGRRSPGYPPCKYCGKRNHPYSKCWNKPKTEQNEKTEVAPMATTDRSDDSLNGNRSEQ